MIDCSPSTCDFGHGVAALSDDGSTIYSLLFVSDFYLVMIDKSNGSQLGKSYDAFSYQRIHFSFAQSLEMPALIVI